MAVVKDIKGLLPGRHLLRIAQGKVFKDEQGALR